MIGIRKRFNQLSINVIRALVPPGGGIGQVLTKASGNDYDLQWGGFVGTPLNNPMTSLGDIIYGGTSGLPTALSGNITTTPKVLVSTGSGSTATAPVWTAVSDLIPGAALTKTDDTNVTLTLGGTPATSLLQAVSLTLGWTGQLAATRGGTGIATYTTGDILYASATNTLSKLAATTNGYVLTLSGGIPVWAAAPSSGATLSGSAHELIKYSSSTSGVASGLFASTNGDLDLGSASLAGERRITVYSSDTNAGLYLLSKGTSPIRLVVNGFTTLLTDNTQLSYSQSGSNKFNVTSANVILNATARLTYVATSLSFSTARLLVRSASNGDIEYIAASGGGTSNFLRADGTWAAPGGGSSAGANTEMQLSDGAGAFIGSNITVTAGNSITIGDSSIATTNRALSAGGSAADINISLIPKGTGFSKIESSDGVSYLMALNGRVLIHGVSSTQFLDFTTSTIHLSSNGHDHLWEHSTSITNLISRPLLVSHNTSGTPSTSTFGTGIGFVVSTTSSHEETVAAIDAVLTSGTTDAESGDLILKTMSGGAAAAERMRVKSDGLVTITGSFAYGAPVQKTGDFTLGATENWIINNKSGSTLVVTLPSASAWPGRIINFINWQNFLIDSASSNVRQYTGSLGANICTNSAGRFSSIVSDGTDWVIMRYY